MNCSQIEQMVAIRRAADKIIKETCRDSIPVWSTIGELQDNLNQAIANARQGQGLSWLRFVGEHVTPIIAVSGPWPIPPQVRYIGRL